MGNTLTFRIWKKCEINIAFFFFFFGYIFFQALKDELSLNNWKLGSKYFRAEKRIGLSLEVEMSIGNYVNYKSYFTIY